MAKGKKYKAGYYLNDEKYSAELAVWAKEVRRAKKENRTPPQMSHFIGDCILKIVQNLATKGNFKNYTWIDEMVDDAIENLVRMLHNYRPNQNDGGKGQGSAYVYTSFIAYQAFIRRIAKEKREQYYKFKNLTTIEDEPGIQQLIEQSGLTDFQSKVVEYENKQNKIKIKQRENNQKRKPDPFSMFNLMKTTEEKNHE